MKHIFSFLAVAALGMAAAFGQCDADFDFMGAEFGISPNPLLGETFAEGEVDQPYADVIHVIIPASTAGIPEAPIELPLDSVVLDSILPGQTMRLQISDKAHRAMIARCPSRTNHPPGVHTH